MLCILQTKRPILHYMLRVVHVIVPSSDKFTDSQEIVIDFGMNTMYYVALFTISLIALFIYPAYKLQIWSPNIKKTELYLACK